MNRHEQNNGKIYQQIEYCVMDLNHDGQMDILIRDSYSKPEYKFHPSVQFFLRSPDRSSVYDAGSVLEWSSSIESDGTDLYHYHFHQGVYRLEKADFSSGEAKFTEIDAQDWNDKPGQPDPGYENQLYWMHYSFGQ